MAPWRTHDHELVAVDDRWPIAFGAVAQVLGATLFLRGFFFALAPLLGRDAIAAATYVLGLWSVPEAINIVVLLILGILTMVEGLETIRSWRASALIRALAMGVFWSYTIPATWLTFHDPATPYLIGALSTHFSMGIPYTVLAFKARKRILGGE